MEQAMDDRMSSPGTPKPPSVVVYALAATVLFVLPFGFAVLLFTSITDPKRLQFAVVCATSLASVCALLSAVTMWKQIRAIAFAGILSSVSAALITWGFFAPDLKVLLSICAVVLALVA